MESNPNPKKETETKTPSPTEEEPEEEQEQEQIDPKLQAFKERLTNRKRISDYCFINKLFFFWVSPLVSYCNQSKNLEFDMMNKLEKEHFYENYSNKIDYYFLKHKAKYLKSKTKSPRTFHLKLILDTFRWEYILQFFVGLVLSLFNYSSSFFIQKIFNIQYLDMNEKDKLKMFGLYCGLMVLCKIIYIISNVHLNYINIKMGLKTFYASSHLVLKKTMKTSFVQNSQYNMGEIINLGTVDSQRFLNLTMNLTYLISLPFTIILGLVYIYFIMGWVLFPALLSFLLLMVINVLVVKKGLSFQKEFMKQRSTRVKVTNEVFNNIKFVKSTSLEHYFINKIMDIRSEELRWLSYIFYRIIYSVSNSVFSPGVFLLVLFSVYVAAGNQLTSGKIFTTISIFNSFVGSLTYLPNIFTRFIDIMISSERLTNYLMSPDIQKKENKFDEKYLLTESDLSDEVLFSPRYKQVFEELAERKSQMVEYEDEVDGEIIPCVEYSGEEDKEELNLFTKSYNKEIQAHERETKLAEDLLKHQTDPSFAKNCLDVQIKNMDFFWTKFWEKKEDLPEGKKKSKKDQKKSKKSKKSKETKLDRDPLKTLLAGSEQSRDIESTKDSLEMTSTEINQKFRLKNINLEIKKGEFVCILGKSGSGKSSLFLSILGELFSMNTKSFFDLKQTLNKDIFDTEPDEESPVDKQSQLNFNPKVSYLSQKPWIRNATLKDNILFGCKLNQKRYQQCVSYSGLEEDLTILSNGDQTIIGDRGINLSGGQKVRVALARALYSESELFLLDDPLSALDVNVGNHVFRKAISGFLADRTRIMVTHNLGYLKYFERIIFMENGKIVYNGGFEELKNKPFYQELKQIMDKTKLVSEEQFINQNDNLDQSLERAEEEVLEEKEVGRKQSHSSHQDAPKKKRAIVDVVQTNLENEKNEKSEVDLKLLGKYFSLGRYYKLFIMSIVMSSWMFLFGFQYIFLNQQGDLPESEFDPNKFYLIFSLLVLGQVVTQFGRTCISYNFTLEVSGKLSSLVTNRLLHASLNQFFHKNPIGKVLNRLSGDIERVDRFLPSQLSYTFLISSRVLVSMIIITIISNPLFLVFVFIYFILVFKMQRHYSKSNIELTRLESITKSPFFQLFTDSVNGIVQIRVFRKTNLIFRNTVSAINRNFQCAATQRGTKYWFIMRLSLFSMLFIIPTFLYLVLAKGYQTSNLGVIINFLLLIIDDISRFMNTLSALENNFVSFARCNRYLEVEPEKGYMCFQTIEDIILKTTKKRVDFKKIRDGIQASTQISTGNPGALAEPLLAEKPYQSLPLIKDQSGMSIVMKNVKVKYSPELPNVLKGISLSISPGEKIGIIGRTGAGKTSFVNLFIRFFDEYEGSILLNGQELRGIYLESLRKGVTFISQNSYFFEGTLRENLDPRGKCKDEEILALLEESEVLDQVSICGGLDWVLNATGGELSVGEKQIFCFLRAIINTQGLIVMDEATSNLDVKSEDILERLKEKYMKDSTLLIIAHRLNTIHSCDKILILDNGKVQQLVKRSELSESQLDYFKNYLRMFD